MKLFPKMFAVFLMVTIFRAPVMAEDRIPERAYQYRRILRAEVERVWGLHLPEDVFAVSAGTIHQESAWNPLAQSPFAKGLTQFTDGTFADVRRLDATIAADVFNPQAAIRAMAVYHKQLYGALSPIPEPKLNRWAFVLSAYNGGLGWVRKDQRLCLRPCDSNMWFENTERFSSRAAWAMKENRDYPRKILLRWVPLYRRF